MSTKPPTDLTPSSETGDPTSKRRREGDESPSFSVVLTVFRTWGQQPTSDNHLPTCSKWVQREQSEEPVGIKKVASLHQTRPANIVRPWESAAGEVKDKENTVVWNPTNLEAGVQGLATGGNSAKPEVRKKDPLKDKVFICKSCNYICSGKYEYYRHMITHADGKLFVCHLCGYKTAEKQNLKKHVLIHREKKPFACSKCCHKTRDQSSLNTHMMEHLSI